MEEHDDRPAREKPAPDYRRLPPETRLDETIAGIDAHTVSEPEAGRNIDQHRALRDD